MKEAAGEANMTVITIVLIAIVLAVGSVVVRNLTNNSKRISCCSSLGGIWENGTCKQVASNIFYDVCAVNTTDSSKK